MCVVCCQRNWKKRREKETHTHNTSSMAHKGLFLLKTHYLYLRYSAKLFFFFFGHFPIQVRQRPEKQKELTYWTIPNICCFRTQSLFQMLNWNWDRKDKSCIIIHCHEWACKTHFMKFKGYFSVLYSVNVKYFET